MKLKLEQLEARLQALIEVRLVSALPGFQIEDLVVQKLAAAMKENLSERNGEKIAPNVYTLVAHPDTAAKWQDPRLIETIIAALKTVGDEIGLQFTTPPTLSINKKENLPADSITVIASHQLEPGSDTVGMTSSPNASTEEKTDTMPENAFLIIDGVKVFPLKMPVINIGRRLDNQLVIDDPRISRSHAQLRAIKGRFVVFDLNSTGGTFVNGQRTSQSVLYPGDVISLAGVPLVFGQDNPPPRPDLADTSPLSSASADRPTAILRNTGQLELSDKDKNEE
ncbi:MAG: hypothetical protein Kow002_19050 [Anaerolineales bacterium]